MRRISLCSLWILLASLVVVSSLLAAEMDPLRSWSAQPQFIQNPASGSGMNGGTFIPSQDGANGMNKEEMMIKALEERELRQELQLSTDSDPAGMQDLDAMKGKAALDKLKTKKPQLLVKNEPGDGLIKLSWVLANLPTGSDDKTLRFTIQ